VYGTLVAAAVVQFLAACVTKHGKGESLTGQNTPKIFRMTLKEIE
jgi:hypothetical protein